MAPCDDPGTPSGGAGDHDHCDAPAGECPQCRYWSEDHVAEVDAQDSKYLDSSQFATRGVRFRFEANLAAGNFTVTEIFEWGTLDPALTEAMKTEIKDALRSDVAAAWSDKHSIKVTDPVCGEKTLPLRFRILWKPDDTSDARQYRVNLQKAPRRSSAGYPNVNLDYDDDLDDDAWTLKHEFGHTFGMPDEYLYSGVASATITYKRADGSTEEVTLEPEDTIMQTRRDVTIAKRFAYFAEIEAQELLRAKSGRNVVCEVQ